MLVVKIVNSKRKAAETVHKSFLDEVGTEHEDLLLHVEADKVAVKCYSDMLNSSHRFKHFGKQEIKIMKN